MPNYKDKKKQINAITESLRQPVTVSKPYLPHREKFKQYIDRIYDSGILTNNGQFVQELEQRLSQYLDVPYVVLTVNGTSALQIAYKVLGLKGKVITTPFSFVATASSLCWEDLVPVFADIDPLSLNIAPENIPKLIDKDTSAILPVHIFGNPCDVESIDRIAKRNGLKVIYDAAHAFMSEYNGQTVLRYGDVSVLSFHATKIFHTIEGGALIFNDKFHYENAKKIVNFGLLQGGFSDSLGINSKMSEIHAAMGLCVLDDIEVIFQQRKFAVNYYEKFLKNIPKLRLQNYALTNKKSPTYFPVIFETEYLLNNILRELERLNIHPRRYFYPSLDRLPYIETLSESYYARDIARRILCLPLYAGIPVQVLELITHTIRRLTN